MSVTHDRQAYRAAKNQKAVQSEHDRALCPPPAARVLNLSYRQIAAAMREHDATVPLTVQQAKWIRRGMEEAPDWLAPLYGSAHIND
ncbi:hypothetical protein LG293_17605 (plasmid) [Citricoccus nitrophenolicus]